MIMQNNKVLAYACGVFTSWSRVKIQGEKKSITLHFAINRFVGKDGIHYDLPANNNTIDKNFKKRVALYIDAEIVEVPQNTDNLSNFKFVDERFNNLNHKNSEYVLQFSYKTKASQVNPRVIIGKPTIECHFFSMSSESIIDISKEGHYLWTEDIEKTKKIVNINEAVDIITTNIVRIPAHINSRTMAFLI